MRPFLLCWYMTLSPISLDNGHKSHESLFICAIEPWTLLKTQSIKTIFHALLSLVILATTDYLPNDCDISASETLSFAGAIFRESLLKY